jgi:DNA primase
LFWAQHDFGISVTTLPDGKDPCDLLSGPNGADEFVRCLKSSIDVLQYKLDSLLRRYAEPSVENTKRIVDSVLGVLALAPSIPSASAQVKQELLVSRLAHRLGLRQETVWARLAELRRERQRKDPPLSAPVKPDAEGPRSGPAHRAEQQLLELLLAEPGLVPTAAESVSPEILLHTGLRRLLSELYALQASGQTPDFDALRVRLIEIDRPDLVEAAQRLQFKGQHTPDRPEYLRRVIDWFAKDRVKAEKKAIKEQLASVPGDDEKAIELLRRLQARTAAPSDN